MPQPLTHQYLWKTQLVKDGLITHNELEYMVAVSIIGCTLPDHFDMVGTVGGIPSHNDKKIRSILFKTLDRYIKEETEYSLIFNSVKHHLYVDTIGHALFENEPEWRFLLDLKKDLLNKQELRALFPKDRFLQENRMESFIHPLLELILDMYVLNNKNITGYYIEYAKKFFNPRKDKVLIDWLTTFYTDVKMQYKNLPSISKNETEELWCGILNDLIFLKDSVDFQKFGTEDAYDLIGLYKHYSKTHSGKPMGDTMEFHSLLQPSLREVLSLSNFAHPSRFSPRTIKKDKRYSLKILAEYGVGVLDANPNFSETFKKLFDGYPDDIEKYI